MGRWTVPIAAIAMLGAGWAAAERAHAEPAAPAAVCRGTPVRGGQIHGPILQVIDARTVCVATDAGPSAWVPVILANPAPNRPTLMAATFGKNAICVIGADGRGRCVIEGAPLAEILAQPDLQKAAVAWR